MIIDFHSHVLPCVDDGSSSMDESCAMMRMEWLQGIEHVVATPHFYARHDSVEGFLERREAAVQSLVERLSGHSGFPGLSVGAEVYYFRGMSDSDVLQWLTIDGGRYILIEMPETSWSESMYSDLAGIWEKQRLIPILAHIDRYISPIRARGIPNKLVGLPVLVQANASFFLGKHAQFAMRLLEAGKIHLLGSDTHNTDSREPNLGPAYQTIAATLGKKAVENINIRGSIILNL